MKNKKTEKKNNNVYPGMIMQKALEILEFGVETTGAFIDIFFSDYNTSYKKAKRFISKGTTRDTTNYNNPANYEDKRKLYTLISRLKKQGFIKEIENEKSKCWRITISGKKKLEQIRKSSLHSIQAKYKKEKSTKTLVIAFDIPEKDRWKRRWLRVALISLDFSFLQQSVWIGQNKIPEKFIKDLNKLGLFSCVHIFEVIKKGTIDSV